MPDRVWGESVKAVVVLQENHEATAGEIIASCAGQVSGYKRPRSVDFVQELPKTATGKISRRLVREPYWSGRGVAES